MTQPDIDRYRGLPEFRPQAGDAARAAPYLLPVQLIIRGIFRLLFRVRVRGLNHLPPGPKIICGNHLSWADPFLVLLFFPIEPRIYALADHHAVGRTGFRAAMMGFFRVVVTLDPDKPLQALRIMEDVVRRGGSLLIFPEGAPTPDTREGELRDLRGGAPYLSALSGVPIVPVGIRGTSELWLGRRLVMQVGKPLFPGDIQVRGGGRKALARSMAERLRLSLLAIIPPPPASDGRRARLLRGWLTNLFA